MERVRNYLRLAGKGDERVIAVFAVSRECAASAVRYVRRNVPDVPVWLFAAQPPDPETAAVCERVVVSPDSMELLIVAQKELWPRWVALSVGTWTGGSGKWPLKLAPFLVPPFRALLMNERQDFMPGAHLAILQHAARRVRDFLHSGWNRMQDESLGLLLWLFALLAQRFSFLSRWIFHRVHGDVALELAPVGSDPQSVQQDYVTFEHHRRHWNWAALDRLVRTSAAEYILFLEGGAKAEVNQLLPLMGDPQTFAVSVQMDFRDWKPSLFATAPFRQLQPGEASQTLAPVSRAILVNRLKLAALGVPKTIVPGTAWLLLFWKAAAAGWKSFSVGGAAKLGETPDWPYEEAEFVTRVLRDPSLRLLGPQQPNLARGSICFGAGLSRGFREKPRVLLVSPYLPYPLSHGGAVRVYNLCRALSDRVDFILACFREKGEPVNYEKLHEVFREVYVVDRDEKAARDKSDPIQVREHVSRSMRALIARVNFDRLPDILQVEFTHLANLRDAAPRPRAILVEHDLTFTLYRQFAGQTGQAAAEREYQRWLRFERQWLRKYDAVWTMSSQDREVAVGEGSKPEYTFVVANGVDLDRFLPADEPTAQPEIFYVGSFRHKPNVLGFERLRHEIMPRVWRDFPDARLRVVAGPDPERHWRSFLGTGYPAAGDGRLILHEFVEDLRPVYAKATVVVVPLVVSAGTNIKVMEAMACGKALVSTPIGCAGLGLRDGVDALIQSESKGIARAICQLLAEPALRGRIAREARRTVEERFSWNAIAAEAYRSYGRLSGAFPQ